MNHLLDRGKAINIILNIASDPSAKSYLIIDIVEEEVFIPLSPWMNIEVIVLREARNRTSHENTRSKTFEKGRGNEDKREIKSDK